MLTQSTLCASGVPVNPEPVFGPASEGRWSGMGVAIRSGMVPFIQSLAPGYLPPNTQQQTVSDPAFTLSSGEDGGFLQGVELAVRLVSHHAGLPEVISNMVGSGINASAAFRFARDQWAAMTDAVSEGEQTDCPDKNNKEKVKKVSDNSRQQEGKLAATTVGGGQLSKAAVALGALSCLATAEAQSVIEVADVQTLGKIGRDPNYPLGGRYRQSSDIDGGALSQSIGNHTHPFTGQYDGQCHTIDNLPRCLVQTMKDGGHVDSLRFTRVNINSTETAAVVACEILDHALVSNILVEKAHVAISGDEKFAGIGGGYVSGVVTNITVINGTATSSGVLAHAGISAGKLDGNNSAVTGSVSLNCKVLTFGKESNSGIGAGHVQKGTVSDTLTVDSSVLAKGENAATGIGAGFVVQGGSIVGTTAIRCVAEGAGNRVSAGIGAGYVGAGTAADTLALDSEVKTSAVLDGDPFSAGDQHAGIGAGYLDAGTVVGTTGIDSKVSTAHVASYAAIGAGLVDNGGIVDKTTGVRSQVITYGLASPAGIGAGSITEGTVNNTVALRCVSLTSDFAAHAGIGAGEALGSVGKYVAIDRTTSLNSTVSTSKPVTNAAIGAGAVNNYTAVNNTLALYSEVQAPFADAGIGVGGIGGGVNHTRAIKCVIEDSGDKAIYWGSNFERCNVVVNDKNVSDTPRGCNYSLASLCKHTAPGLVTEDCKPDNRVFQDVRQALKHICHSQPLPPDFLNPQQVGQCGACRTRPVAPTNQVTVANNTVPVSISALPSTAAPLTTVLSGAGVVGIAVVAVAASALMIGGVCRRYNRSNNS